MINIDNDNAFKRAEADAAHAKAESDKYKRAQLQRIEAKRVAERSDDERAAAEYSTGSPERLLMDAKYAPGSIEAAYALSAAAKISATQKKAFDKFFITDVSDTGRAANLCARAESTDMSAAELIKLAADAKNVAAEAKLAADAADAVGAADAAGAAGAADAEHAAEHAKYTDRIADLLANLADREIKEEIGRAHV
jgi:hypothetical protein